MILKRATTPAELVESFKRTFVYWGAGYEDTVDAWVARKLEYNAKHRISVYILLLAEDESQLGETTMAERLDFAAHAEVHETWQGLFPELGRVAAIGSLFVPEELRRKGYAKSMMTMLMHHLRSKKQDSDDHEEEEARQRPYFKAVVLMAGGADHSFYSRFGFKRAPYTLHVMKGEEDLKTPLCESSQMEGMVEIKDLTMLETVCDMDKRMLQRQIIQTDSTSSSWSLLPTTQKHVTVGDVYLTFGNAPVPKDQQCFRYGVVILPVDNNTSSSLPSSNETTTPSFLIWAHFYRNKRLCITRIHAASETDGIRLLEAARREAVARGFETVYLWLDGGEGGGVIEEVVVKGRFKVQEWFDEPMGVRFDRDDIVDSDSDGNDDAGGWLCRQRWVTITM